MIKTRKQEITHQQASLHGSFQCLTAAMVHHRAESYAKLGGSVDRDGRVGARWVVKCYCCRFRDCSTSATLMRPRLACQAR
eukprot:1202898-Amphidinium_carterae.1